MTQRVQAWNHIPAAAGDPRSGHAASSSSLQALRKGPRLCSSAGSNRDSHPQRGAVHHRQRSCRIEDPSEIQKDDGDHRRHRHATAGTRERPIGAGARTRRGRACRHWPRRPPHQGAIGAGGAAQALHLETSGLARGSARPAPADRCRAAVPTVASISEFGRALPRGCRRDRRPQTGGDCDPRPTATSHCGACRREPACAIVSVSIGRGGTSRPGVKISTRRTARTFGNRRSRGFRVDRPHMARGSTRATRHLRDACRHLHPGGKLGSRFARAAGSRRARYHLPRNYARGGIPGPVRLGI